MYYICEYCGNTDRWEYHRKCHSCGHDKIHVIDKTFITKECPVCLENKESDNIYLFKCGHNTCKQCSVHLNKCPLCETMKMEIYDGNNIKLPIGEIIMMPDVVIPKDNYKYIIMFIEWIHCCKEYKKLNGYTTYCVPFKNPLIVKFIKKYYDKYLLVNRKEDNIVFFWTECNSFQNVYIDMYKKLYPNGQLHSLNGDEEYNKKFCLNGSHQLFIKNIYIHNGPSTIVYFDVGDTLGIIKQRYTIMEKIMNQWDERVYGLWAGKKLYDDFVFDLQHRGTVIGFLFNMRGD